MLTELYLDDNNFGGMFSLALIDRLYIWMTSVTELIFYFFIFLLRPMVHFNWKYKIICPEHIRKQKDLSNSGTKENSNG
jgi:hypothetical protein